MTVGCNGQRHTDERSQDLMGALENKIYVLYYYISIVKWKWQKKRKAERPFQASQAWVVGLGRLVALFCFLSIQPLMSLLRKAHDSSTKYVPLPKVYVFLLILKQKKKCT